MQVSMTSIYNWYRNTLRHPKYRWWLVLGTLAYLISPIDISPDFIPIVGQIDDVMLATLLVTEVSQLFIEKFKSRKETVEQDTATNSTVEVEAETVVTEKV
ncbi:conserved hypothetical protein [Hyella patelloides LEGE 07179]|uniref:DUF1232 domain-containing protein n=1 Tax=Hyella patelloides LEGE 07179 TaxID=945734 RepID=A0A563VJG6_9CYAN|nr:conserved hypothetical protein [Hyella patelloides LEGE 07179]